MTANKKNKPENKVAQNLQFAVRKFKADFNNSEWVDKRSLRILMERNQYESKLEE